MRNSNLEIGKLKSCKFKAYIWGQPDNHLMDWNGCNYRYKCIDGQPIRGYNTIEDVKKFISLKFKNHQDFIKYACDCGDGTFISDEKFKQFDFVMIDLRKDLEQ